MFPSLANPDFRLLWVGSLGAAFAMQMQVVARGWLIYDMTASPLMLTWVLLSFSVPSFLFSLFGGVLADRVQKKRVMIVSQLLNATATLLLAIIVISGEITFMHFIWFGLFNGTILSLSMPARSAVIPEIVGDGELVNAMALSTAGMNLSRVLGPAFAGAIIALTAGGDTTSSFGVGVVFMLIAALYFVSVVTIVLLKYEGNAQVQGKASVFGDIRDGLRYMAGSKLIFGLLLMSFLPMLFGMPIQFLMPAYNQDVLGGGADDLGLLLGANGIGALLGSLLLARLGDFGHKGAWMFGCCFLWALFMGFFSYTADTLPALGLIAAIGLCSSFFGAINMSLVQLAVAPEMRGRVMSIMMMTFGLMPVGVVPVGWIAEVHGIGVALWLSAWMLAAVTLILLVFFPTLRRIGRGYAGG